MKSSQRPRLALLPISASSSSRISASSEALLAPPLRPPFAGSRPRFADLGDESCAGTRIFCFRNGYERTTTGGGDGFNGHADGGGDRCGSDLGHSHGSGVRGG